MHRLADELAHIKDLLRNHPQGMSVTEIASALGRNKHSTGRYLDILHAAGHVDLRTFGMAKVFTLSSRVPLSALLSYTTDLVLVLDRDDDGGLLPHAAGRIGAQSGMDTGLQR